MEEEDKIKGYKLHNTLVFLIPQCDIIRYNYNYHGKIQSLTFFSIQ